MMKNKKNLFLFVVSIVVAGIFVPGNVVLSQAAPRYATALLEGRTHDQAHSTGYIDWSGSIGYVNFFHRSLVTTSPDEGSITCGGGCTEPVTKINNGGIVSGSFQRDVTYFEVMNAYEYSGTGVGSAVLTACSSSITYDLSKAKNTVPGFNSFSMSVPAGCRTWSLRATGGHIHFRSTDVQYVTPTATPTSTFTFTPTLTFTPTATPTFTFTPTLTFTPTATFTGTPLPTHTFTNTPTSTLTFTPTSTGTLIPTNTPTITQTYTPTFTATATSTGTLLPTNTATYTPTPTNTMTPRPPTAGPAIIVTMPVSIIIEQRQNVEVIGGSGSGGTLSGYAVTPTPPHISAYAWLGGSCNYALRVLVYVDENGDHLMSPQEGADYLEVLFMEGDFDRLGSRYTKDGIATFCIHPGLYGERLLVQLPYLHKAQEITIPSSLSEDVEVWFKLDQPELPLYLP